MAETKMTLVKGYPDAPLPPDEDLWDVRRAAGYLGMSVHWVYKAVERERIPHTMIGSRVRFIPKDLRLWVEGGRL